MRDENRIPAIMARLQKVWEAFPDLRLAQLIGNVTRNVGHYADLYYVEDEDFIKLIENFYGQFPNQQK